MMKKCSNGTQEESNFLFAKKENEECQNVPAMRCKIEKRKVGINTCTKLSHELLFMFPNSLLILLL